MVCFLPILFFFEKKDLIVIGLVLIGFFGMPLWAGDEAIFPEPLSEKNFTALKTHSPFIRSVGLSDSIILTGMARVEHEIFATLLDTTTSEIQVISKTANSRGWYLIDVKGDETDLTSLSAKIQVSEGEVISIRYENPPPRKGRQKPGSQSGGGSGNLSPEQLKDAKHAAINYKKGAPADGYSSNVPPEVIKKLSKINVQQREAINRKMITLRNRGMGSEARRKIYNDALDRTIRGGRN